MVDCVTSFEIEPPDGAEMGRRVERLAGRTPWLAFQRAGNVIGYKLGAWHDVVWLERPLASRIIDPPSPKPLSEVCDTVAFRDGLASGLKRS